MEYMKRLIIYIVLMLGLTYCSYKTQEERTKEISDSLRIEDSLKLAPTDTVCGTINDTCKHGKRK